MCKKKKKQLQLSVHVAHSTLLRCFQPHINSAILSRDCGWHCFYGDQPTAPPSLASSISICLWLVAEGWENRATSLPTILCSIPTAKLMCTGKFSSESMADVFSILLIRSYDKGEYLFPKILILSLYMLGSFLLFKAFIHHKNIE